VVGNDDGREDMALAWRPQGDGGYGREGNRSEEEGNDVRRLLDKINHAGTTSRGGARVDKTSPRVHGVPKRWSPRGLGIATCPGQSDLAKSINHSTEGSKQERDEHKEG
jgi:hypothetical protein